MVTIAFNRFKTNMLFIVHVVYNHSVIMVMFPLSHFKNKPAVYCTQYNGI